MEHRAGARGDRPAAPRPIRRRVALSGPAGPADPRPTGGLRTLLGLQPSPPRLRIALNSGVAMLLAIGLPTLAGHSDLGLLASAGALSALYLGSRSRRERAVRLPFVQVALLAAAALGVASAGDALLAAGVLAAVTCAGAVLTLGLRTGPPGVLFLVLVTGVAQRLTAPAALGGAALAPLGVLGGVLLGEGIAYLVVVAPLLLPSFRAQDAARPFGSARFRLLGSERRVLARLAAGVLLGSAAGGLLGLHRSYWVVLAAVAVLQAGLSRRHGVVRGLHRLVGTLGGTAVFAALAVLHPQGLALAVVIALLQFTVELVVVRHYGIALLLITPLALLIADAGAGGDVVATVVDRIQDTVVGVALAVLVLISDFMIERLVRRSAPTGT